MKPFLLLQVRSEDIAVRDEYIGFLETMGLSDTQLVNMQIHGGEFGGINLELFSGVILGGGPPNISDEQTKKTKQQLSMEKNLLFLMDEIIETDFPFLGVCYGHGILGLHQGAEVTKKYGEEFGDSWIELTENGLLDDICSGLGNAFSAFVGHKESIEKLPNNFKLLATSKDCPIQFIKLKTNIYGVQFHPELDQKSLKLRAEVYKHSGYFPKEEVHNIVAKIDSAEVNLPKKILQNFARKYTSHT